MSKCIYHLLFASCGVLLLPACHSDPELPYCFGYEVSYSEDIAPFIVNNCALSGCHDGSSALGDFTDYLILKEKIDEGIFYYMVIGNQLMPPGNPLSEEEIKIIECWLEAGAPKN